MFISELHWITEIEPLRLGLMPAPLGGDRLDEGIAGLSAAGVNVVVSLIEPFEVLELDLALEESSCKAHGIQFLSLPIKDHSIPASASAVSALVDYLVSQLRSGMAVVIHCRAGIGRAGVVAACVMHKLGLPLEDIFPALERARGVRVPETMEQVEWVNRFAREFPNNGH